MKRLSGLLLTLAFLFSGCSTQKGGGAAADDAVPVTPVHVAPVVQGTIHALVNADGVVFPITQANVTPKISAPVARFLVQRGDHVRKGQLLAVLENRDLVAAAQESKQMSEGAQATYVNLVRGTLPEDVTKADTDVATAQENVKAAQAVYDSRQKLLTQGAIARKLVDDAKVALVQAQSQLQTALQHQTSLQTVGRDEQAKNAQAQAGAAAAHYQAAEAQASYAEVRSPMSGVVADRPISVGEMAGTSGPLFSIVDVSRVVVHASVPVEQTVTLRVGAGASIQLPDGPVTGRVTVVSPAVDPNTTVVQVWVEFANTKERLKLGSSVSIAMDAGDLKDAVIAPAAALLSSDEGGDRVFVVGTDNLAHERAVKVGIRSGDQVQILSGVQSGEQVIVDGALGLDDKAKIEVAKDSDKGGDSPSDAGAEKEK